MKEHDQFLSVIHVDQIKHLYTSRGSKRMLGIDPTLFNGAHFLKVTHPDEQLLNMGQLYSKREFEIIKLIESGKAHISELIYELKERASFRELLFFISHHLQVSLTALLGRGLFFGVLSIQQEGYQ